MSSTVREPVESSERPFSWPLLELDSKGRVRIAGTRCRITMIAVDHNVRGYSAEQIHEQYPYLGLSQIHSALAYYYEHQDDVEAELAEEQRFVGEFMAQHPQDELRAKLRKLAEQ